MTGLALSVIWAAIVVAATVAVFHGWTVASRLEAACLIFAAGLVGLIANLTLMPPAGPEPVAEALLSIYFYGFWFFGVFAQLYLLADRGFSLAMLTDFGAAGGRTRDEIKRAYAGGAGVNYVKQKRLPELIRMGWVRQDDQRYRLTPLGHWIGRACLGLHRLYRFRETG